MLVLDPYQELAYINIITFLPSPLPSENKKLPCASNPVPYAEYLYLSKPTFLINLAVPNKEFSNVTSALILHGHKFIS